MSPKTWDALKWLGLLLGLPAALMLGGGLSLSAAFPALQAAAFVACAALFITGAFKARPSWKGAAEAVVGLLLLLIVASAVRQSAKGPYFRKVRAHAALIKKLPQAKACSGLSEADKAALTPQLKAALNDPDADVRAGAEDCLLKLGVSTATIVFPGSPGP